MVGGLQKYKITGHFLFNKGDSLLEVSREVPDLPGVYYILRHTKGKEDLVYYGKSGSVLQDGTMKMQQLRGRINNKQDGRRRQDFFEEKMAKENIDALDIYWFVTMDKTNKDLPGFVEGNLMQRHFEMYGKLPEWNKEF